jgi:hypothetical protein
MARVMQLASGNIAGEVHIWRISDASLRPALSLSTHGHITSAVMFSKAERHDQRAGAHQLVVGTEEGDVVVWDIDMGAKAEAWEAPDAQVQAVGITTVDSAAVLQLVHFPGGAKKFRGNDSPLVLANVLQHMTCMPQESDKQRRRSVHASHWLGAPALHTPARA